MAALSSIGTLSGLNLSGMISGYQNAVATASSVGVANWVTFPSAGMYLLFTGLSSGSSSNTLNFYVHSKVNICVCSSAHAVQFTALYDPNGAAAYSLSSSSPLQVTYNYVAGSNTVRAWWHKLF
eukprot:30777-Eustigmatos_ZCMA.PRE.1